MVNQTPNDGMVFLQKKIAILTAPVSIILTNQQIAYAGDTARRIHKAIQERGGQNQHGATDESDELDILGKECELAACEILELLFKDGTNATKKDADAGDILEVRGTDYLNGRLIYRGDIHIDTSLSKVLLSKFLADNLVNGKFTYKCKPGKSDFQDRPYVLVIKVGNKYTIQGWLWGSEIVKMTQYIEAPPDKKTGKPRPPCWMIPQHKLNKDLAALFSLIKKGSK